MRYFFVIIAGLAFFCCDIPPQQKKNGNAPDTHADKTWILPFIKADAVNPILIPDSTKEFYCPVRRQKIKWEEKDVFNPAAVVRHDTVFLLYRAEDKIGRFAGTSRIGLAWSTDGLHFTRLPEPLIYPDNDSSKKYEWEGGCEDPRIAEADNGTYYLTYTGYDGDKARLMVAYSRDLYHWIKHGLAFANAGNGKYINEWSKSGSIVCTYKDGNVLATKINGKYWMYWGDTDIFIATSDDLIHWVPVEDNGGKLIHVFGPRKGKFDSDLVESGPAAMLTDKGILLIYNSRNVPAKGDPSLPEGTYAASQILLDKSDPTKVLTRMESYFIKPDKSYEISGQVNRVCFVEGLVKYRRRWFLYYGTADSKIAVAVK